MLRLRRGTVVQTNPLTVEIGGEQRPAWADTAMVGEVRRGDEVIVNVTGIDLELGSGGFDIVHVNLSRGIDADVAGDDHVLKLNYTSLQHAVDPIELAAEESRESGAAIPAMPVLSIPLHGHLAPALWAAKARSPEARIGYVQTSGGALPGALSRDAIELRNREMLAGHVTAGPAHGGQHEAISLTGGLDGAARALGWDAAITGPGPGILGSASRFGHGGMAALDAVHAALALGLETCVSPRLSSGDPRPRHLGLSHHTRTVLESVLAPVTVALPAHAEPDDDELPLTDVAQAETMASALAELRELCEARGHRTIEGAVDFGPYRQSGMPARTMGRSMAQDEAFFAAALAAGDVLGGMVGDRKEGGG